MPIQSLRFACNRENRIRRAKPRTGYSPVSKYFSTRFNTARLRTVTGKAVFTTATKGNKHGLSSAISTQNGKRRIRIRFPLRSPFFIRVFPPSRFVAYAHLAYLAVGVCLG